MLQQSFDKWTSGNEFIDKFIQETQLNAKYRRQILEWIPYNKLEDIKYLDKGGFSTIYKAIWSEGPIKGWDDNEKKWTRYNNLKVVLKNLDRSSNLNDEFLSEV